MWLSVPLTQKVSLLQWHQQAVARKDPSARAIFWGDMLEPWHNGNTTYYQQMSGGIAGGTWGASMLLDKRIIQMPWILPWTAKNSSNASQMVLLPASAQLNAFFDGLGTEYIAAWTFSTGTQYHGRFWNKLIEQSQGRGRGQLGITWAGSNGFELYDAVIPLKADGMWNMHGVTRATNCASGRG